MNWHVPGLDPQAEFELLDYAVNDRHGPAARARRSTSLELILARHSNHVKKYRLSVYLDPALLTQLNELADRQRQPKSLVAEAAIASFLTPDDSDRREAAFTRRLDRLTRQVERLERDLTISVEAIALFVQYWLTLIPTLPETAQAAAQAKGRERFALYVQTLGRRLAGGKSFLREISFDVEAEASAKASDPTAFGSTPNS
jgi:hypothetical protein